eukprot:2608034-Pleurochrysis_carterae.AAC.2
MAICFTALLAWSRERTLFKSCPAEVSSRKISTCRDARRLGSARFPMLEDETDALLTISAAHSHVNESSTPCPTRQCDSHKSSRHFARVRSHSLRQCLAISSGLFNSFGQQHTLRRTSEAQRRLCLQIVRLCGEASNCLTIDRIQVAKELYFVLPIWRMTNKPRNQKIIWNLWAIHVNEAVASSQTLPKSNQNGKALFEYCSDQERHARAFRLSRSSLHYSLKLNCSPQSACACFCGTCPSSQIT